MIDPEVEQLMSLAAAGRRLRLGVSPVTIARWASKGCGGVKLEVVKLGGRWRTSEEAVKRFLLRLTEGDEARPTRKLPRPPDCERRLARFGLTVGDGGDPPRK